MAYFKYAIPAFVCRDRGHDGTADLQAKNQIWTSHYEARVLANHCTVKLVIHTFMDLFLCSIKISGEGGYNRKHTKEKFTFFSEYYGKEITSCQIVVTDSGIRR
jgi:hypothetical protein